MAMQLASSNFHQPLNQKGCSVLADALGDTPKAVISAHVLRCGLCRAYVAGDPASFDGAIVEADFLPGEPAGFGSDPEVLWDLLKGVKGWDCVDVALECATALGEIIEEEMGVPVRYYGDIYHILSKPIFNFPNEAVRQLTFEDLKLLESAPAEVQGCGFGNPRGLLSEGIVACAIVSGEIVAIAHTSARTKCYADIGAFTLKEWRGYGLATAAASIVAKRVQETGQIPVWSTGADNIASLRIAQKLGFTEVSRSTYVIPEKVT